MSPLPINNDILRGWVSWQLPFRAVDKHRLIIEVEGETKTYVGVYSFGPFSSEEFRAFAEALNFYVVDMDEDDTFRGLTLIIGEYGWKEGSLGSYLDRALEWAEEIDYRVRIYSQEMFLLRALSGIDPFDAPKEVLEEFGRGHPALEYLASLGFDWPSCQAFPGRGSNLEIEDKPGDSPLTRLGYHVGKTNGIADDNIRQGILERAFLGPLPTVGPPSYMDEWGAPNTSARLKKMANKLASHVRNAKRRNADMELAITRWEADLESLRRKFYSRAYQYQWPWPSY